MRYDAWKQRSKGEEKGDGVHYVVYCRKEVDDQVNFLEMECFDGIQVISLKFDR